MDFKIKNGVLEAGSYSGPGGDVVIPDDVVKLEKSALETNWGKKAIKSVTIPASVVEIESGFEGNTVLEKISVDPNNPVFEVRNNMLVNKKENKIVLCVSYDKKELVIDDDIKVIGSGSFINIPSIEVLRLPEGFEKIESGAFGKWQKRCNLKKIYFSSTVKTIEKGCFEISGYHPVTELHVNAVEEFLKIETDGIKCDWKLYVGDKEETEITIPSTIGKISSHIFENCKNVKKVVIEDGVTSIDESAFAGCSELVEITIPGSVIEIGRRVFSGCSSLKNVKLPASIKRIEELLFYECVSITSITIPSGVEFIGKEAFASTSLSKIDIPKSVTVIEECAFKANWSSYGIGQKQKIKAINVEEGNPVYYSSNGALIERRKKDNIILSVPQASGKEFKIADEITGVHEDAFKNTNVKSIYMPKNFVPNGKMLDKYATATFEAGFLKRQVKLPTFCIAALSDGEDCAYSIMYQSGKTWDDAIDRFCKKKENDVCQMVFKLVDLIKQGQKENGVKKATEFVLKYIDRLDGKAVKAFYQALFETKSAALSILINDLQAQNMLLDGQLLPAGKTVEKTYSNPIEKIVSENWKASDATKKLQSIITSGIKYADSEEVSSPEAVIMVIALYAEQLDDAPNYYSKYKTSYVRTHFNEVADQIAEGLNKEELQELLEDLAYNERYQKDGYLLPFGRFASLSQISALMANMRDWESWGRYGGIGRKNIIIARGALMLSDYREVMMAIDKVKGLSYYASIRNTDEDTLRDSVLAEFGFDEKGEKTYDLGGNKAVISLAADLSLSIFDENAGKEVKSLPKKGTDEKLYEKAKSDLSDLRKNIKRVITNRKNLFFVDFLEAKKYEVESWKKSYLTNPVLNAIACLVVWQQKKKTFVPTRDGKLIDYTGAEIELSASDKIKIAHPIEMSEKDIIEWQNYFVNNSLKQPFEQIWEPVYKEENIKKDRYKGCVLPVLRFSGKDKHGISAYGIGAYSENFGFDLKDCELSCTTDTWRFVPGITDDATYELGDFTVKKFTRYTNHIIYLLDKWTIEERIAKNDASIGNILDGFTVAQILDFISLATEKKSTDSLAVLMDYKNKQFNEYDPMQEFTLD